MVNDAVGLPGPESVAVNRSCTGVTTSTPWDTPSTCATRPLAGSMARAVNGSPVGRNGTLKYPVASVMEVNGARRCAEPGRVIDTTAPCTGRKLPPRREVVASASGSSRAAVVSDAAPGPLGPLPFPAAQLPGGAEPIPVVTGFPHEILVAGVLPPPLHEAPPSCCNVSREAEAAAIDPEAVVTNRVARSAAGCAISGTDAAMASSTSA